MVVIATGYEACSGCWICRCVFVSPVRLVCWTHENIGLVNLGFVVPQKHKPSAAEMWSSRAGHSGDKQEFKGSRGHCPLCLGEVCVYVCDASGRPTWGHQLSLPQLWSSISSAHHQQQLAPCHGPTACYSHGPVRPRPRLARHKYVHACFKLTSKRLKGLCFYELWQGYGTKS